jgi:flagellar hook assembly protein FlgD
VESRATTAKTAYMTGEEIDIHFSFRNITDETQTFPFPPEIRIGDLGSEVLRTFDVGQVTMTLDPGQSADYDLTWDQKDEKGNQVPPGEYQVIIPNIQLGEGKGVVSLVESPILSISSNP